MAPSTLPEPGRVLAITGGASGIGFAAAERHLAEPANRVVLLDRDELTATAAAKSLGDRARGHACDVTDRESVDAAFADIAAVEGALHGLVACAGISRPARTAELSDDDWSILLDVHLSGTLRACRAAHPLLSASSGAIVTISSIAGTLGMPRRASYNAAKAGIEGLTRSLAVEWAPDGIRCNAVAPGYVRTPFTDALIASDRLDAAPVIARTPLRRFAEPAEIAAPICWLLSDDASFVTGHVLRADGGITVDGDWYGPVSEQAAST